MVGHTDPSEPASPGAGGFDAPTDRISEWVRTIIDELPQFVFVKSADGTHVLANKAIADSHGISVEQLEGTTDEQYAHDPEDRDFARDDEYVLTFGESVVIPEERIVDADGTERIVKSRLKRIEGPDGENQLLIVATDITEEKRRQRELEQQRDLLARIERISLTGGWELDPATETVEWTAGTRQIFGVGDDFEPTLENALSFFHPDDRDAVARAIRRCLDTHEPYDIECRIRTVDGETRWVTTKGEALVEDGSVSGLRGAINDITVQKRRELELQRQNDRLDEFASVVAHDLRNPLSSARGYTELAGETGDIDHLSAVRVALDRMDAIVADTLTLAREGQTVGERSSIDVADLAERCWHLIETADARLDCVDPIRFRGDPDRLQHVFENLFRNAIDHGDPAVTVSLGPLDDGEGFYIEDDGPGIPATEREDVFEPGYSTRTDGTGFGLAIVKRIAEAHGWSVSLTESAAGGVRFEFDGVDMLD